MITISVWFVKPNSKMYVRCMKNYCLTGNRPFVPRFWIHFSFLNIDFFELFPSENKGNIFLLYNCVSWLEFCSLYSLTLKKKTDYLDYIDT